MHDTYSKNMVELLEKSIIIHITECYPFLPFSISFLPSGIYFFSILISIMILSLYVIIFLKHPMSFWLTLHRSRYIISIVAIVYHNKSTYFLRKVEEIKGLVVNKDHLQ